MSLLAGFDFVVELSRDALLGLIEQNLVIGGAAARPPFEVAIPLSGGGLAGEAHLIITALNLTLNADDTVTLTLTNSCSSVQINAPGPLSLSGLDGEITIRAGITLANASLLKKRLALHLEAAIVGLNFPKLADNPALPAARTALEEYVRSLGIQTFPPDLELVPRTLFDLKPTGNGSLLPPRFVRLKVHRIDEDTLGLFGILLAANDDRGDHTLKTATAIAAGNTVSVSLSPAAFHTLVFCAQIAALPALKDTVTGDVSKLPTSCGAGTEVSVEGVALTQIADSFGDGYIALDLALRKSGDCPGAGTYELTGSLHAEVSFAFVDGKLKPTVKANDPDLHVSLSVWCAAALLVVSGPLGFAGIELLKKIGSSIAGGLVNEKLSSATPTFNFGSFFGAKFTAVQVTPEGLTLNGQLPAVLPPPKPKGLDLQGSVEDLVIDPIGTGTYTSRRCPKGEFPYTEYARRQAGVYKAVPTRLCRPLTVEWFVGTSGVPLTGASGTASLTLVRRDPFPLPGGTYFTGPVSLTYKISGDHIELANRPEDGNFSFYLGVRVTEPDGTVYADTAYLEFEGHEVLLEGYLGAWLKDCVPSAPPSWPSPMSDPPGWPSPKSDLSDVVNMVAFIGTVITSGVPDVDDRLAAAKLAFNRAFDRAVFSVPTSAVDLPGIR